MDLGKIPRLLYVELGTAQKSQGLGIFCRRERSVASLLLYGDFCAAD